MLQAWPCANQDLIQPQAETEMQWVKEFTLGVRQIRGESNIAPGKPLAILLKNSSETDRKNIKTHQDTLIWLARLDSITVLNKEDQTPESATALVGEMQILIPLAGLINKQEEIVRLEKELAKREKEKARLEGKLSNANFIDKAPPAVVDKEREKLCQIKAEVLTLEAQKNKISQL
jgi:valyl-tRNA synthetase